jgi:hypothetical protein
LVFVSFARLANNHTKRQSQVFHERLQTGIFVFATTKLWSVIGFGGVTRPLLLYEDGVSWELLPLHYLPVQI